MATLDRILLHGHSQYRFLILEQARGLKTQFGSEIHLYCATEQEAQFWRERDDGEIFKSVTVVNVLYATADLPAPDVDEIFERAREFEEWLGITINSLALLDRHLGRGFALGGFNHPRSRRSENTSYVGMVNAFCALIEFWRGEFENKRPTLVLGGGKLPALLAQRAGVPFRILVGSRFKNYHQWAYNEFFENPEIEPAFHLLGQAGSTTIASPYESHMNLRVKFVRDVSVLGLLLYTATEFLRRIYWRLRRYEKAKGYYGREMIRHSWRRRSHLKTLDRLSQPMRSLDGERFVYYPLHTEPETALQCLSPEYFYQLSSIAAIARDLPVGVKLVVKETYEALGRRPTDFYRQICEFKNVVMLDMMELGLEVVRRAEAVVTITGTGGFEAAVMGKPVITFGRHNQYNFLPHVHLIESEDALAPILLASLDGSFDHDTARENGARFLSAVVGQSFDLHGYDLRKLDQVSDEAIRVSLDALLASLSNEIVDQNGSPPKAGI